MLLEQTIDKLYAMKLDGMAAAIREQMTEPAALCEFRPSLNTHFSFI